MLQIIRKSFIRLGKLLMGFVIKPYEKIKNTSIADFSLIFPLLEDINMLLLNLY